MKFRNILYFIISLILMNCGSKPCILPDDFGFPKIDVLSYSTTIHGQEANQYIDWVESGYKLNGDLLYLLIRPQSDGNSRWTGWFCNNEPDVSSCSNINLLDRQCEISPPQCPTSQQFADISNRPCFFANGQGLYGLVAKGSADNPDPNASAVTNLYPPPDSFITFHLGDGNLTDGINSNLGGFKGHLSGGTVNTNGIGGNKNNLNYKDKKIYFKILDNYYSDNAGGYTILAKQGLVSDKGGPIQTAIGYITYKLGAISKTLVVSIISDPEYKKIVSSILVLFVVISSILFMMGVIHLTHKELIIMIFKIAFINILLTGEYGWKFFNGYFFDFFKSGLSQLIGMLISGVNIDGGAAGGLALFDNVLGMWFASATTAKILAFFSMNPLLGFFVFFGVYFAFFFLTKAMIKAVLIYLMSYISICLLIIMAPIFFIFILFHKTKELFEIWLNQLASYFFQPLLVFASLGFFFQMIIDQMQRILGFPVCWKTFFDYLGVKLKFWAPNFNNEGNTYTVPFNPVSSGKDLPEIPLPGYVFNANSAGYCEPYQCTGQRYPSLPFLDPSKSDDIPLIKYFLGINGKSGVIFYEVFVFIVMSYVVYKFIDVIPAIAKGVAGTAHSYADTKEAAAGMYDNIKGIVKAPAELIDKAVESRTGKGIRTHITEKLHKKLPFKERRENIAEGYRAFMNIPSKIGGKIEGLNPFNKIKKSAEEFDDRVNSYRDRIGSKYDALNKFKDRLASMLFGTNDSGDSLFGTDHRKAEKDKRERTIYDLAERKLEEDIKQNPNMSIQDREIKRDQYRIEYAKKFDQLDKQIK